MHEETNTVRQIDLTDLWLRFYKSLRRFWLLVLIPAVLFSAVWVIRGKASFAPRYEAKARFSVSSAYNSDDIFSSGYYDNYAAQQLADAFPHILSTDLMRDLMLQQLDKGYINGSIRASSVANTNMFVLTVNSGSAQDAYDILCAAIDCYPQVAVYMVDNPQVIIRQAPTVPTAPVNSFSWKNAALKGALIGLVLGLVLVAGLAMLVQTVGTVDQLKSIVNLPILAVLPRVTPKKRRNGKIPVVTAASDRGMAEALRGFVLKIRKQIPQDQQKVILVTSTLSGEGKTTISTNLALALAKDGNKVVILDADFRKQSVAMQMEVASTRTGLMECLKDPKKPIMDCLAFVPNTDLAYLSAGSISNQHYSIDSKQMRKILQDLSHEFEYVIIDTAPCGIVADATLLCHYASSLLYVVKPDYASRNRIVDCVNSLYEKGAPITGFVFNGMERSYNNQGYGSKYGYGYGYGSYGKKRRRSTTK